MSGLESIDQNSPSQSPLSQAQFERPSTSRRSTKNDDVAAGPSLPASHMHRAIAAFERSEPLPAVPDAPHIIDALMRNAVLLCQNREYQLSMNLLRNVLMRKPNEPEALRYLGHCLKEMGRFGEAERCFRALVARAPKPEHLMDLADVVYALERDKEAIELYTRSLSMLTQSGDWHFEAYKNLGNIHVRAGDFESAEECYNKANTLKPSSDVLMVNYGTLAIQRENYSEAVDRFREAIRINMTNDRAWVGLAMVHHHMADHELAIANVERALDINPRNRTALHLLVDWTAAQGQLSASIRRLTEYLALDGEDAEISFLLAKILTHVNRIDEAMLEAERFFALDPMLDGGQALYCALRAEANRRTEMM